MNFCLICGQPAVHHMEEVFPGRQAPFDQFTFDFCENHTTEAQKTWQLIDVIKKNSSERQIMASLHTLRRSILHDHDDHEDSPFRHERVPVNGVTIGTTTLEKPDAAFLAALAQALRQDPAHCLDHILRKSEESKIQTGIHDGRIVQLALDGKLGHLTEIPALERLDALCGLSCTGNRLVNLDFMSNAKLTMLIASQNEMLENLDISACPGIWCIKLDSCPNLRTLRCRDYTIWHLKSWRPDLIGSEILETTKSTSTQLDQFSKDYNRDDGPRALRWVIEQEHCDLGTALYLYWTTDPVYYYSEYADAGAIDEEFDRGFFELLMEIERRVEQGLYRTRRIRFDPRAVAGRDMLMYFHESQLPQRAIPTNMTQSCGEE